MKLNDLRTLIREEIQNELAEAKKKKKDEAKEKIMEIIIEAELTKEELEEAFLGDIGQTIKKGVAKIGLGSYPAPQGNHEITPEALKAVFNKMPKVIKYYMSEYKMTLDQLIKLYQTAEGKEFNDARYWIQTWYDATVKKDEKAIKAWKNADTQDAYKYLPNPQGAVGLASTAGNSATTVGGI